MAQNHDIDRHREGHEAFGRGDLETLSRIIAEDTVWHVPGRGPLAGEYRGREAVFSFFNEMMQQTEGTLQLEDEAFLEGEGHTAALSRIRAKRGEKELDVRMHEIVRWRDGRVAEEWVTFDDQYALDEFWS